MAIDAARYAEKSDPFRNPHFLPPFRYQPRLSPAQIDRLADRALAQGMLAAADKLSRRAQEIREGGR